jgi:hypothetical protein
MTNVALQAGAQHHRPARALSCPNAALWLPEIGKARSCQPRNGDRTDLCWFR